MIYQEIFNYILNRINFNSSDFAKKYALLNENFTKELIDDTYYLTLNLNEAIDLNDTKLSIIFKRKIDFVINNLVLEVDRNINLSNRVLVIKTTSNTIETRNYSYQNGILVINNINYDDIINLYYIDKNKYSGNYQVVDINTYKVSSSNNLANLDESYTIHNVYGYPELYFIESEDLINSFLSIDNKYKNMIFILPSINVGSKSNNVSSVALAENFTGNDYVLSRVNNFYFIVKISKIAYNNINNRLNNMAIFKALDEVIPSLIKTIGGFLPKNVASGISYKDDGIFNSTDEYILYRINFEFVSTIESKDLTEDTEYDIDNFNLTQGEII